MYFLGPTHLRHDKVDALLNINTRRHSERIIEQEIDCKGIKLDNKTLIKR